MSVEKSHIIGSPTQSTKITSNQLLYFGGDPYNGWGDGEYETIQNWQSGGAYNWGEGNGYRPIEGWRFSPDVINILKRDNMFLETTPKSQIEKIVFKVRISGTSNLNHGGVVFRMLLTSTNSVDFGGGRTTQGFSSKNVPLVTGQPFEAEIFGIINKSQITNNAVEELYPTFGIGTTAADNVVMDMKVFIRYSG